MRTNIKNLYRRKDGRYEYKKRQNGEMIRFTVSTKEQALEKLREIKQLKKKTVSTKETFVGWTEYWLKVYKQNTSNRTREIYQGILKNHIAPYFANMSLRKLTPAKIQEFLNTLKPGSRVIDFALLTIKQSLKQAFINGKIALNLADMIVRPGKKKKSNKTALSLEEQIGFMYELKTYDQDTQIFLIFSIICGTRKSETHSFTLEDILPNNKIHIKGTKTYTSDRKIKISEDMLSLLRSKPNKTPYFERESDYYSRVAHKIFEKLKIKKSLHDLRHTCSTNLHYLGWPDKERQHYLGHASIVMTNDIYTNLQDDITAEGLIKLYNNLYPQI